MALHLIKLSVGITDIDHLARVQAGRRYLHEGRAVVPGWTKRAPTRTDALLDGGSIYWVIKGQVRARQLLLGFEAAVREDGSDYCRIILDPTLVAVLPLTHKPFQGWRYLDPSRAPADLASAGAGAAEMPPAMVAELRELGLL